MGLEIAQFARTIGRFSSNLISRGRTRFSAKKILRRAYRWCLLCRFNEAVCNILVRPAALVGLVVSSNFYLREPPFWPPSFLILASGR